MNNQYDCLIDIQGADSMCDAVIAKTSPYVIELEPGTYGWCRCGRSKNQPLCEPSHKDTDLSPVKLEQSVALCGCKRSANKPFCGGTHNTLV